MVSTVLLMASKWAAPFSRGHSILSANGQSVVWCRQPLAPRDGHVLIFNGPIATKWPDSQPEWSDKGLEWSDKGPPMVTITTKSGHMRREKARD